MLFCIQYIIRYSDPKTTSGYHHSKSLAVLLVEVGNTETATNIHNTILIKIQVLQRNKNRYKWYGFIAKTKPTLLKSTWEARER